MRGYFMLAGKGRPAVQFQNDKEADTAGDNKADHSKIDDRIGDVGRHAVAEPQYVKPGVAESRDGVEYAVVKPPCDAEVRHKAGHQQKDAGAFGNQGEEQDVPCHAHDALQMVFVQGFLKDHAFFQGDALADQHEDKGSGDHEAEPADLDQQKQDNLSEQGKGGAYLNDAEAGDADGGGCREKRVQQSDALP